VTAAIERHPEMVYKHHMDCCLLCHSRTSKNLQTRCRRRGTGAHIPEPGARPPVIPPVPRTPPPPGPLPAPPGDSDGYERYKIEGMPSSCVYIHSLLPNTQFFNHTASAKDSKPDKDFIPELLHTLSAVWKSR